MNHYFIAFHRKHVDTGEPLTDMLYCWTFDDRNYFDTELQRLGKMDHITLVGHGCTIHKTF